MQFHLFHYGLKVPDKDAGVPKKFAAGEEDLCKLLIRLLCEGLYVVGHSAIYCGCLGGVLLNVSVPCLRSGWGYAKGEEVVVALGVFHCAADGVQILHFIKNGMVRWCYHYNCIGIPFCYLVGGIGYAGRCVSAKGFHKDILLQHIGKLLFNLLPIFGGGYAEDILRRHNLGKSLKGLLKEGFSCVEYVQELLWHRVSANRPKAAAYAARHYNAIKIFIHNLSVLFSFSN